MSKVHKLEDSANGMWWTIPCGSRLTLENAADKLKRCSREDDKVDCRRCRAILKKRKGRK